MSRFLFFAAVAIVVSTAGCSSKPHDSADAGGTTGTAGATGSPGGTGGAAIGGTGGDGIGGQLAPYLFFFANVVVGAIAIGTIALLIQGRLLTVSHPRAAE